MATAGLRLRWLERVFLSGWFRPAAQGLLLMLFLGLVVLGWQVYAPAGVDSKLFARSNLVTLLVWGLWWPCMVIVAVVFGRVWCSVCPLELVSRWGEQIRKILALPRRSAGPWLRAGWMILVFYAVVQMLIAVVGLNRTPMFTSLYLLLMLSLALVFGILYTDRAYCRILCPVGLLLKIYGRGAALAVRPARGDLPTDPQLSKSCASQLNPLRLDTARGDDCLLCADCVRADAGSSRMGIYLRMPWSVLSGPKILPSLSVTLFIVLVSGFVAYEVATLWTPAETLFLAIPDTLASVLDRSSQQAWFHAVWTLVVFPASLWSLLALPLVLRGRASGLIEAWRILAYPVSLVIIAGHLTKALEKLSSWSGYLPLTLRDPQGIETAQTIATGSAPVPSAWLPPLALYSLGLLFFAWSVWMMRKEARRTSCRPPITS